MKDDGLRFPLLLVISAPSGAGKTTLCDSMLKVLPGARRAVTCTTRKPRNGEQDGRDYYFIGKDEFLARVEGDEFLENAIVHGNHYGVLKSELKAKLADGNDVLLNIDVQGAATIRERAGVDPVLNRALVSVFLAPPSLVELEHRLRGRSTETEENIVQRLLVSKDEMEQANFFDHTLISQTREADLERLLEIVEQTRRVKLNTTSMNE